jgi:hypothetical protein
MKKFEDRRDAFIKDYGELVKKYQVDLATFPVFMPNKEGSFDVKIQNTVVDISEKKDEFVKTN